MVHENGAGLVKGGRPRMIMGRGVEVKQKNLAPWPDFALHRKVSTALDFIASFCSISSELSYNN